MKLENLTAVFDRIGIAIPQHVSQTKYTNAWCMVQREWLSLTNIAKLELGLSYPEVSACLFWG